MKILKMLDYLLKIKSAKYKWKLKIDIFQSLQNCLI